MFGFNVGFRSKYTDFIINDIVYVKSNSLPNAIKLLLNSFSNISYYNLINNSSLPYIPYYFSEFIPTINYYDLLYDYAKCCYIIYPEEIVKILGYDFKTFRYSKLLRKLGFKFNKSKNRYELKHFR